MPKKSFWEFFIANHRFTKLLVVGFIVLGVVALNQLPKESMPEVEVPFGVVTVPFPGASPEEVEELVTDPIEDKLVGLDDLDELSSVSRSGLAQIFVLFDVDADPLEKITDLKDQVDLARPELPDEANDPIVRQFRFDDSPILRLALSGPFSVAQLKGFAEDLKDDIMDIPGVSDVQILGGQDREIQVVVSKARLDEFELSLPDVTMAISQANADIPAGSIETAGERYALRFAGKLADANEILQVPVGTMGGVPILVSDVAEVQDGLMERSTASRLGLAGTPSEAAVSINLYKVGGGDIISIVDGAFLKIDEAREQYLPAEIRFETVENIAQYIRNDLNDLGTNGLQTVAIVVVLLLLFLGWRESTLAAISIPLTFLISFIALLAMGGTFNFLSLFSLILALGILVDGAIVITESMYTKVKAGSDSCRAAVDTIREFRLPLTAGTLTTVFAFLPMVTVSGIMGKFIEHIPITISIVLVASIFVALGITTTIGVRVMKNVRPGNGREEDRYFQRAMRRLKALHKQVLLALMNSKKLRRRFAAVVIALAVASFSLPATGALPTIMFPPSDEERIFFDTALPVGTPLEGTEEIMAQMEAFLAQDPIVASYLMTSGAGFGGGTSVDPGSLGDTHKGYAVVRLVDKKERKETSTEISERYRQLFAREIEADVSISQGNMAPSDGAPVEVRISGDSLQVLEDVARDFELLVKDIPGTTEVGKSVQESNGEFVVRIDRIKAEAYGVSTMGLARTLRNAIHGSTATTVTQNSEDIDVVVKYALDAAAPGGTRTDLADLAAIESLTISTSEGDIPLSAFTKSSFERSRGSISHEDGERMVTVTAKTTKGTQPVQVFEQIRKRMGELYIPAGYDIDMGGELEDIDQSFSDLSRALFIGIFLIAVLLVLQFRSYRQPIFILVSIPLALIGVYPGLVIVGQPLSMPGMIGIVALAGIVVNNAIILIDKMNRNRREGMGMDEAVLSASQSRLQPILLTSVTTVLGILPLAISNPVWGPIGYSIVFGLAFSSFFTLLVVPILYRQFAKHEMDASEYQLSQED